MNVCQSSPSNETRVAVSQCRHDRSERFWCRYRRRVRRLRAGRILAGEKGPSVNRLSLREEEGVLFSLGLGRWQPLDRPACFGRLVLDGYGDFRPLSLKSARDFNHKRATEDLVRVGEAKGSRLV